VRAEEIDGLGSRFWEPLEWERGTRGRAECYVLSLLVDLGQGSRENEPTVGRPGGAHFGLGVRWRRIHVARRQVSQRDSLGETVRAVPAGRQDIVLVLFETGPRVEEENERNEAERAVCFLTRNWSDAT
jgi:hypothetical protein